MLSVRRGLTLLVAAIVAVASGVGTSSVSAAIDDAFVCYGATPASVPRGEAEYPAFTPVGPVTVVDTFSSDHEDDRHMVDLRSVESLCSPAVIGGRGVGAPAVHLEGYRLRQSRTKRRQPAFEPRVHTVTGTFGEVSVLASRQEALLVPVGIALGTTGAPTLSDHDVDHFQCYRARPMGAVGSRRLMLADGFGGRLYDVGRPTRLCLPADVNSQDSTAPKHPRQLLCHRARLARTQPRQPRATSFLVSTKNELGDEVVRVGAAGEVCLPVSMHLNGLSTATPRATRTPTSTPTITPTRSPSPSPTPTGNGLIRISIRPPEIARLPTEVKHFWATGHYGDGSTRDLTNEVVWASSDTAVATAPNDPADPNRMDLHALGTALISAMHPATGVTTNTTGDDAILHVTGPLNHIDVHPYYGRASRDGYEQFTAVGYYWNSDNTRLIRRNITQNVEWSVTHPAVASADNLEGDRSRIVARAPGVTSVYATDPTTGIHSSYCHDVSGYCWSPRLAVLGNLETITLSPTGYPRVFYNLRTGHKTRLAAIGHYEGGGFKHITQECTFSAENAAIFGTPNLPGDRGAIEALSGGTTTLKATHDATGIVSTPFTHYVYGQVVGILISPNLRPRAHPLFPAVPFRWLTAIYTHGTGPLQSWEVTVDDPTVAVASGVFVVPLRPGTVSVGVRDPESGYESPERLPLTFYGDLERVVLSPETVALRPGDEDRLTALLEFEGGYKRPLTQACDYSSNHPAIVEAPNGAMWPPDKSVIRAVAPGEAVISAVCNGQSSSALGGDTLVTVIGDLRRFRVTPKEAATSVGRSVQFTATGEDGAERAINLTQASTWSVSDAAVAAAANADDDRSRIDGIAPGTVTVRGTDPVTGRVGDATLTVIEPLGSLLLLPETLSLIPGANDDLTAVGIAADGNLNLTQEVLYASDAPDVVKVTNDPDARSRIIAVAPGTARITATDTLTGLHSDAAVVTVVDPTP